MPADIGGKSPLRDGSNEESILAEIKQISSLLQFKTCAPALSNLTAYFFNHQPFYCTNMVALCVIHDRALDTVAFNERMLGGCSRCLFHGLVLFCDGPENGLSGAL